MLIVPIQAAADTAPVMLQFEHSLVSLSKWEAIHEKAFFRREDPTEAESESYIQQMLLSENPPEDYLIRLSNESRRTINDYINSKQSATWFQDDGAQSRSQEVITSELIYYWMISFQIPFECETWHLNRLMTLIRICGIKQTKPKRMSRQAQAEQYRALNAQRRAAMGTSG